MFLDPFGFVPHHASRIIGLGGSEASNEPSYAFHTPYIYCAPGAVTFRIKIDNLSASVGNLTIRVNGLPPKPGAGARTVKMTAKTLRELAYLDGELIFSFKAKPGVLYAVLGLIYGESDARADGMSISLDRPDDGARFAAELEIAKQTVFGQAAVRDVAQLVSVEPAMLANPVSQMCTAAQFDEPVYQEWLEAMKSPRHRHRKQWEFVYIMQALDRYGMLQDGARGIGFGVGEEPLPAVFAARGCSVLATDLPSEHDRAADWRATSQHIDSRDNLRRPDICPDERFSEAVTFRPVDMTDIPDDIADYDFCWSSCALEHLGSIEAGLQFITNSLKCLKLGGVAVHTTELNLSSNTKTVSEGGTVLFRRQDFERLALELVSLGHSIAQIKYDQGDTPVDKYIDMPPYAAHDHLKAALSAYVTTSFGIIVRKGELSL
jgi:hypothetical protein